MKHVDQLNRRARIVADGWRDESDRANWYAVQARRYAALSDDCEADVERLLSRFQNQKREP